MNEYGLSPSAHLGDGCLDIIMVEAGSRFNLISYIIRTAIFGNAVSYVYKYICINTLSDL